MGRKKQRELNDSLLLTETELEGFLGEKFKNLSQKQKDELSLSLYEFTMLIHKSTTTDDELNENH